MAKPGYIKGTSRSRMPWPRYAGVKELGVLIKSPQSFIHYSSNPALQYSDMN
jgi:hypothetical protein